jgi:short-subunit dehydrogenase
LRASARVQRRPLLIYQTSYASVMAVPGYGVYRAAKSAPACMCDCLRIELEPFGIGAAKLLTGIVTTLLASNLSGGVIGPKSSYPPIKKKLEKAY